MDLSSWLPPELDLAEQMLGAGSQPNAQADLLVDGLVQFELSFQWVHKRGKVKPCQYWAYCEGYQANYVRVQLAVPGFAWGQASRIFGHRQNDACLVLIEDAERPAPQLRGLLLERELGAGHGIVSDFARADLVAIEPAELMLKLSLREDTSAPVHPQQGAASAVQVEQEVVGREDAPAGGEEGKAARPARACGPPEPFSQTVKFVFKKRTAGWFVLQGALYCRGMLLASGTSAPFMLYDPRIRNRSRLAEFSVKEIKFMEAFALTPTPDEASWLQLGLCLGCDVDRVTALLTAARRGDFFQPVGEKAHRRRAKRSASLLDSSSALPSPIPDSKRRRTSSDGGALVAGQRTTAALSKPILFAAREAGASLLQELQQLQQRPQTPGQTQAQALRSLAQPWPLRQLSYSPTALPANFETGDECLPVLFQWLTASGGGLQRACFVSVHVRRSTTLEEFQRKVLLKRASADRAIAHLYCLRGAAVTELLDTMDLQSLLGGSEAPRVLVAPAPGRPPPARLFSLPEDNSHSEVPSVTIATAVTGAAVHLPEFAFTVDGGAGDIREVYSVPSLSALSSAISREFSREVTEIDRLTKRSTGARLTSDKNVAHLQPTDCVAVHWAPAPAMG